MKPCPRCMSGGRRHSFGAWAVIALVGTFMEGRALRSGRREHTLSHTTRSAFATHTPVGRAAFSLAWLAFSAWYWQHVVKSPHNYRG